MTEADRLSWNHRIIRISGSHGYSFSIHECMFSDVGDLTTYSWTQNPITLSCGSMKGLTWQVERILEALKKPVLEIKDHKLVEVALAPIPPPAE